MKLSKRNREEKNKKKKKNLNKLRHKQACSRKYLQKEIIDLGSECRGKFEREGLVVCQAKGCRNFTAPDFESCPGEGRANS